MKGNLELEIETRVNDGYMVIHRMDTPFQVTNDGYRDADPIVRFLSFEEALVALRDALAKVAQAQAQYEQAEKIRTGLTDAQG